jgi:hypothetical protein
MATPVDYSDPKKPIVQLITAVEIWTYYTPTCLAAYVDGENKDLPVPALVF